MLQKIVAEAWDNPKELAQRNLYKYLAALDDSIIDELFMYHDLPDKPFDKRKAGVTLMKINQFVQQEPASGRSTSYILNEALF